MHTIDEGRASAHEQYPAYSATEHGHKGLVDIRNVLRGNEHVAQKYHNYYRNGHFWLNLLDWTYIFGYKNTQKKQILQD
jgi:hypothetical protein